MTNPNVALEVTHQRDRPLCRIRGELDIAGVATVRDALRAFLDVGEEAIDLDLSQVEFMGAAAIDELVRAHNNGLRMKIVDASPAARRALDITAIEAALDESPTRSRQKRL